MEGTVASKKLVGTLSTGNSMTGGLGTVFAKDGKSAYEVALENGFEGTEQEWLESLKGDEGNTGSTPSVSFRYDEKTGGLFYETSVAPSVLPIATPETLGGVKPTIKTEEMTQSVGVDETGGLWTLPSGGGSGGDAKKAELIADITTTEEVASIKISQDLNGKGFVIKDVEFLAYIPKATATDGVIFNFAFSSIGGTTLNPSMSANVPVTAYGKLLSAVAIPKEENTPTMVFASNSVGYVATANSTWSYVDRFYVIPKTSGNVLPVGTRVRLWGVRK